jgi:hypothetical protein
MNNKKQVNDYLISQLLSLFSYVISLGIFYFMLVQFHYETYLEREFGDLGRIFIEANSSWVDPIKIWFIEIRDAGGRYGDVKRLAWALFSIGILSEAIKFTLKASLFNDNGIEKIVSDVTGTRGKIIGFGLYIGLGILFMFSFIGIINTTII